MASVSYHSFTTSDYPSFAPPVSRTARQLMLSIPVKDACVEGASSFRAFRDDPIGRAFYKLTGLFAFIVMSLCTSVKGRTEEPVCRHEYVYTKPTGQDPTLHELRLVRLIVSFEEGQGHHKKGVVHKILRHLITKQKAVVAADMNLPNLYGDGEDSDGEEGGVGGDDGQKKKKKFKPSASSMAMRRSTARPLVNGKPSVYAHEEIKTEEDIYHLASVYLRQTCRSTVDGQSVLFPPTGINHPVNVYNLFSPLNAICASDDVCDQQKDVNYYLNRRDGGAQYPTSTREQPYLQGAVWGPTPYPEFTYQVRASTMFPNAIMDQKWCIFPRLLSDRNPSPHHQHRIDTTAKRVKYEAVLADYAPNAYLFVQPAAIEKYKRAARLHCRPELISLYDSPLINLTFLECLAPPSAAPQEFTAAINKAGLTMEQGFAEHEKIMNYYTKIVVVNEALALTAKCRSSSRGDFDQLARTNLGLRMAITPKLNAAMVTEMGAYDLENDRDDGDDDTERARLQHYERVAYDKESRLLDEFRKEAFLSFQAVWSMASAKSEVASTVCQFLTEYINTHKHYCRPQKKRFKNISSWGEYAAMFMIAAESLYGIPTSHLQFLVIYLICYHAASEAESQPNVFLVGQPQKFKSQMLNIICSLMISVLTATGTIRGTFMDLAYSSAKADSTSDNNNDRVECFHEIPQSMLGTDSSHGKGGKIAPPSDQAAIIQNRMTSGKQAGKRHATDPETGRPYTQIDISKASTVFIFLSNFLGSQILSPALFSRFYHTYMDDTPRKDRQAMHFSRPGHYGKDTKLTKQVMTELMHRNHGLVFYVWKLIISGVLDPVNMMCADAVTNEVLTIAAKKGLPTARNFRDRMRVAQLQETIAIVDAVVKFFDSEPAQKWWATKGSWDDMHILHIQPFLCSTEEQALWALSAMQDMWESRLHEDVISAIRDMHRDQPGRWGTPAFTINFQEAVDLKFTTVAEQEAMGVTDRKSNINIKDTTRASFDVLGGADVSLPGGNDQEDAKDQLLRIFSRQLAGMMSTESKSSQHEEIFNVLNNYRSVYQDEPATPIQKRYANSSYVPMVFVTKRHVVFNLKLIGEGDNGSNPSATKGEGRIMAAIREFACSRNAKKQEYVLGATAKTGRSSDYYTFKTLKVKPDPTKKPLIIRNPEYQPDHVRRTMRGATNVNGYRSDDAESSDEDDDDDDDDEKKKSTLSATERKAIRKLDALLASAKNGGSLRPMPQVFSTQTHIKVEGDITTFFTERHLTDIRFRQEDREAMPHCTPYGYMQWHAEHATHRMVEYPETQQGAVRDEKEEHKDERELIEVPDEEETDEKEAEAAMLANDEYQQIERAKQFSLATAPKQLAKEKKSASEDAFVPDYDMTEAHMRREMANAGLLNEDDDDEERTSPTPPSSPAPSRRQSVSMSMSLSHGYHASDASAPERAAAGGRRR